MDDEALVVYKYAHYTSGGVVKKFKGESQNLR